MNNDKFLKENDKILQGMLERSFFHYWKMDRKEVTMFKNLELELSPRCNLGCTYCYIHRNGKELYPEAIRDEAQIMENLSVTMDWLIANHYTPEIELFSGSPLSQDLAFQALELIYDKYKATTLDRRTPAIVIPTNGTFILNDSLTERVEDLIKRFKELDINMALSMSIEGKYMEQNRPFNVKQDKEGLFLPDSDQRDDDYYDKVFKFAQNKVIGFHPMVYSQGIDKWKKNFLWYMDQLYKHSLGPKSLYLLEVRNEEWSDQQIIQYAEFIEFLVYWVYENLAHYDKKKLVEIIFIDKIFNILSSNMIKKSRGTPCSIQTTLFLRMGDLSIIPCHRQSYDGYNFGRMKVSNGLITGVEADNIEMAIGISSFDAKTQPYCQNCILKEICGGGCYGANLESTGDAFTPIPTVCELTHTKAYVILSALDKIGSYEHLLNLIRDPEITEIYNYIMEDKK